MSKFLLSVLVSVSFLSLSASAMEKEQKDGKTPPVAAIPQGDNLQIDSGSATQKGQEKDPIENASLVTAVLPEDNLQAVSISAAQPGFPEESRSGIELFSENSDLFEVLRGFSPGPVPKHANRYFHKLMETTQRSARCIPSLTDEKILRFPNLRCLDFYRQSKLTAATLSQLTKLRTLFLSSNSTMRDDDLSLLTSLTSLHVVDNKVITDRALSSLTNLNNLRLQFTKKITGSSLKSLTNLTTLEFHGTNNITGNGLQLPTTLRTLSLRDNTEITDISYLTNLRELTFSHHQSFIYSPPFLTSLEKLPDLQVVTYNNLLKQDSAYLKDSLRNVTFLLLSCR